MASKKSKADRTILDQRAKFLAFLRSRVGSEDQAEELLQEAYVKALEGSGQVKEDEKVVAWFYRILRNVLIDHYRRRGARNRALERYASDPSVLPEEKDLEKSVCQCVGHVIEGLKPEYSDILKKAELEEKSLSQISREAGTSSGNAAVRLSRARKSLKKSLLQTCGSCAKHGCLDCSCKHPKK